MRCEHTEAVITVTGSMSVKHQLSKKSPGVNAQCGATLKWFKISSSSFSCKCGPQATALAWAEIKPHWNLCSAPQVIPLLITVTDISPDSPPLTVLCLSIVRELLEPIV